MGVLGRIIQFHWKLTKFFTTFENCHPRERRYVQVEQSFFNLEKTTAL